jgi:hypothetical protein
VVPIEFFAQNAHFAVSLVAALASFAVFWLIFDAWTQRRNRLELIKWLGFLVLAVAFLLTAATLEERSLIPGILSTQLAAFALIMKIIAYGLIIAGQVMDPLQKRPEYKDDVLHLKKPRKSAHAVAVGPIATIFGLPLLALGVAGLYWRRATIGLERHLKPVAYAFVLLGVYELLAATTAWQTTNNPLLYRLVQAYGPLWWAAQFVLLAAGIVLGRWVWAYLTKRLLTQLFMFFVTATVTIFFVSTVSFSFLLLSNVQSEALNELATAGRVLGYSVVARTAEISAQTESVSQNQAVMAATEAQSHPQLMSLLQGYLSDHSLSTIMIVSSSGQVLLRAEDPERWGDSLSADSLVRRGLVGGVSSSVVVTPGVTTGVSLVASHPIRNSAGSIVGVAIVSRAITNAFVDGIKHDTGLDSTVFAGNVRSATTLVTADGTTRAIGTKETNVALNRTVLNEGNKYQGVVSFQNVDYLGAFVPLKDADNQTVGMLSVVRPQSDLLATAGQSIQLTFLLSILLIIVSVGPIYLVARRIAGEVR